MKKKISNIAIALRAAREQAGLSQYRLAELSGVSRPAIAGIELGRHKDVKIDTLNALAKALGVSVSHFLDDGEKKDSSPELAQFLQSEMPEVLKLTQEEVASLKCLPSNFWRGHHPTIMSYVSIVQALRQAS